MNISMIADQQNCLRTELEEILQFSLNEKSRYYCLLLVASWKLLLLTARHTRLTTTFRTFTGEQIKIEEEIRLQNMQNIR